MPIEKLMNQGKSRKQAIAIMIAKKRKGVDGTSAKASSKKSRGFASL